MVQDAHKDGGDAGENIRSELLGHLQDTTRLRARNQNDFKTPEDAVVHHHSESCNMEDGEDAEHALFSVFCIVEPSLQLLHIDADIGMREHHTL